MSIQQHPKLPEPKQGFLTIRKASELFNLPYWKLSQAVREGVVPHYTLTNSRRYVREEDILRAVARFSAEGQINE